MKRLIFIGLLFIHSQLSAALSMDVDSSSVQLGQSFRLLLNDDSHLTGIPDLTPLQRDFNIMGTEHSTSYTVINGKATSLSQWVVTLAPKKLGRLVIPPIHLGQATTDATTIEVTAVAQNPVTIKAMDNSKDVLLDVQVSNEHPLVNEQVIYTVRLYNTQKLIDASYQAPTIDDALLIPLGSARQYQTTMNGRYFSVDEQRYAIFPQKSGKLTIKGPLFSALVYDDFPEQVKTGGQATILEVQPAPVHRGESWVPAKKVSLSESYDKDRSNIALGTTLVRTLTVEAVGLPAQLLPQLTFADNDSYNVYPEKPQEKNILRKSDLVGISTTKITYLMNKAGKVVIPAQKFSWFNTLSGKEETAVLPEFVVNVLGTPIRNNGAISTDSSAPIQEIVTVGRESTAWWIAGGFALAWLVTMLLWWRKPQLDQGKNYQQIVKALEAACLSNQPELAKEALLDWASYQWPTKKFINIAEISALTNNLKLQQEIHALSKALYMPATQAWKGETLWKAISAFKREVSAKNDLLSPLPPINPR